QTNVRQIRVTIGVALKSNFDDTDDRQEHDQIPKPADEKIRAIAAELERDPCRCHQEDCGKRNLPPCESIIGMRIEHGKICRPEQLPDVNDVTDQRVFEPPPKRQLTDRGWGMDLQT